MAGSTARSLRPCGVVHEMRSDTSSGERARYLSPAASVWRVLVRWLVLLVAEAPTAEAVESA